MWRYTLAFGICVAFGNPGKVSATLVIETYVAGFQYNAGIATDASGNVYALAKEFSFGAPGGNPRGHGSSKRIFKVADSNNDGTISAGEVSSFSGLFFNPESVVMSPGGAFGGMLYAAAGGTQDLEIYEIDASGNVSVFVTGISRRGVLAFDPLGTYGGDLYVADSTGIVRVKPDGSTSKFTTSGQIEGIAFDTSGRFGGGMFATDIATGSILRIMPDGTSEVFATGLGDVRPLIFDTFGIFGSSLITASADGKLLSITPDGNFSTLASGFGIIEHSGSLAMLSDGSLLVADTEDGVVYKVTPEPETAWLFLAEV